MNPAKVKNQNIKLYTITRYVGWIHALYYTIWLWNQEYIILNQRPVPRFRRIFLLPSVTVSDKTVKVSNKIIDKSVVCWFFWVVVRSQQKPMYAYNLGSSLHSNIFAEKEILVQLLRKWQKKLDKVLFIVYPMKTMQRVAEVTKWTLWYHSNN